MHGIVGVYGIFILISFVVALCVSLLAGLKTPIGALVAVIILLVVAVLFSVLNGESAVQILVEFPILLLGLTLGMFGALPGAAAGRWMRARFLRKDS